MDMANVIREHRLDVDLTAQVLGVAEDDEPNPYVHIAQVSSGQFLCGGCEKEHDFLMLNVMFGDDTEMVLMLPDEDARILARECGRLLEASCGARGDGEEG